MELARRAVEVEPPPVRRGRPPLGPRPVVRKDRGGPEGIVYMAGDGPKRSLGIPGDRLVEAERVVQIRCEAALGRALGHVAPWSIPLATIFEYEKKKIHPGPKATVAELRAYKQRALKLDRLLAFFGDDITAGDVTPDLSEEYRDWLMEQPARPGTKCDDLMSVGTVRMDLAWGRAAVNRYAKRHNFLIPNGFEVPKRPAPRQHWLTRSQVARLLESVLWGWEWDEAARGWRTEADPDAPKGCRRTVDPSYRRADVRARGRQLARAILIMFYTGTRSGRARNLLWTEGPYCGWIDVDRGVIRRSGMLVGKWAGPGRSVKPAGTALLPEPLLRLARRWRDTDARGGILAVIHKADGECYGPNGLYQGIKPAAVRCGLPDMVVHEFRHSCVTHCLRAGCSISDTALFVDMTEEMVRTVYGHIAEEATRAGAAAMADKRHQPKLTSRDLAGSKPRELLTPQQAMALRQPKLAKLAGHGPTLH